MKAPAAGGLGLTAACTACGNRWAGLYLMWRMGLGGRAGWMSRVGSHDAEVVFAECSGCSFAVVRAPGHLEAGIRRTAAMDPGLVQGRGTHARSPQAFSLQVMLRSRRCGSHAVQGEQGQRPGRMVLRG